MPLGKSKVQREGDDVSHCRDTARFGTAALKAAEMLSEDGIESQVIDLRSLRPCMDPIIEFLRKPRAVIAEKWRSYGVGSEVSARIYVTAFDYVDAPVKRVAQAEVPLPYNARWKQMRYPK